MVKVISLSNEAYARLAALKGAKSFSETVISLTEAKPKKSIMEFFGALKDRSKEWGEIEKRIYEDRKKFKLREVKL